MKFVFQKRPVKGILFTVILPIAIIRINTPKAQSCAPPVTTTATSYSNITFPNNYDDPVLSIRFLSLNAKRNGAQVLINWEVTNEKEITNYIIERSYNGSDFFAAAIVGNKPVNDYLSKYNFSDASAGNNATICYRIIAQDADGKKIVSRTVTLQTVLEDDVLNISPVPATSYSSITWSSTSNIKLDITLFDVAGHTVLNRQYPLKKGVNELLLTNLETLPAGMYFVKAFDGEYHRNGKLIIHHAF